MKKGSFLINEKNAHNTRNSSQTFRRTRIFLRRGILLLAITVLLYGIGIGIPRVIYLYEKQKELQDYITNKEWERAQQVVEEIISRYGVQRRIIDLHLEILIHTAETTNKFSHWINLLQVASRYKSISYSIQYTSRMYYALTSFYLYASRGTNRRYISLAIDNFEKLQKKNFKNISIEQQRNMLERMVRAYIDIGKYEKSWEVLKAVEKMGINVIVAGYWSAVILHAEGANQDAMERLHSIVFSQEDMTMLSSCVDLLVSLYQKLNLPDQLEMLVDYVDLMVSRSSNEVGWASLFLKKYGGKKVKKKVGKS